MRFTLVCPWRHSPFPPTQCLPFSFIFFSASPINRKVKNRDKTAPLWFTSKATRQQFDNIKVLLDSFSYTPSFIFYLSLTKTTTTATTLQRRGPDPLNDLLMVPTEECRDLRMFLFDSTWIIYQKARREREKKLGKIWRGEKGLEAISEVNRHGLARFSGGENSIKQQVKACVSNAINWETNSLLLPPQKYLKSSNNVLSRQ